MWKHFFSILHWPGIILIILIALAIIVIIIKAATITIIIKNFKQLNF